MAIVHESRWKDYAEMLLFAKLQIITFPLSALPIKRGNGFPFQMVIPLINSKGTASILSWVSWVEALDVGFSIIFLTDNKGKPKGCNYSETKSLHCWDKFSSESLGFSNSFITFAASSKLLAVLATSAELDRCLSMQLIALFRLRLLAGCLYLSSPKFPARCLLDK